MSKVTHQAFARRSPSDVAPSAGEDSLARASRGDVPEGAPAGEPTPGQDGGGEAAEQESGADLKATVTLSGEALAALLEEVKSAQRAASAPPEAAPTPAEDDPDAPARRPPHRRAGKT